MRNKICLNGFWEFSCKSESPEIIPSLWEETNILVPSPYNINSFAHGYYNHNVGEEYYVSGGDFRMFPEYPPHWDNAEYGFYKRNIFVKEESRGKRLFLVFDAIAYKSIFFINGNKIGAAIEAFLPVEIEITDYIKYGCDNELVVGVQSAASLRYKDKDGRNRTDYPEGSFWGGHIAGIWQDVWLCERPVEYIKSVFGVTDVYNRTLTINYECVDSEQSYMEFGLSRYGGDDSEYEILDVTYGAGGAVWQYEDGAVELWDIDKPTLYMLHASLYRDGILLDKTSVRIGFRTFTTEGNMLVLNGRRINLKNDSWHYMGYSVQTPEYARSYYKMARDANVNIIRLHAQPFPSFFIDIADETGMLIVSESAIWASHCIFSYNEAFFENCKEHLKRLIVRDRNHPSVVMWSPENECIPAYKVCGSEFIRDVADLEDKLYDLTQVIPKLDNSRIISCDGSGDLGGRMAVNSLHYPGYNCPTHREKPITIGEMGSMYFSTPDNVGMIYGEAALKSFNGRLTAVAMDAFHNLTGQRKWAAQVCVFNLIWYGLEPLPFKDKFLQYADYTAPGIKPSRITPYLRTLNAGAQEDLPDYIPNPVFEYTKRAFMPVRFFVEDAPASGFSGEKTTFNVAVFNDLGKNGSFLLKADLITVDGSVVASESKTYALESCSYVDDVLNISIPDVVKECQLRLSLLHENEEIHSETLPFMIYNRQALQEEWESLGVACLSDGCTINDGVPAIDCRVLPPYASYMKPHNIRKLFSNVVERNFTMQFCAGQNGYCFSEQLNFNAKPLLFNGLGAPVAISLFESGIPRILCGLDLNRPSDIPEMYLLRIILGKMLKSYEVKKTLGAYLLGEAGGNTAAMLDELHCSYELIDRERLFQLLDQKQDRLLIVDGKYDTTCLKYINKHNFKNVLVTNIEKAPDIFYSEFSVSGKKSFHLQAKQGISGDLGIYGNNLYGLGSGREEIMATGLLQYNNSGNILIGIPDIDWRMWNNNAEYLKTVSILKSEKADNSKYAALSCHRYAGSNLYFCQLSLNIQGRKTKNLFVRLLTMLNCSIEMIEKNDLDELLFSGLYSNKINRMLINQDAKAVNPGLNRIENDSVWRIANDRQHVSGALAVFVYSPQDRTDLLLNPDTVDMYVKAEKPVSVYLNSVFLQEGTEFTVTSITFKAGWNKLVLVSSERQAFPSINFKRVNLKRLDLKFGLFDGEIKPINMQNATVSSINQPNGVENATGGGDKYWQSAGDQHNGMDLSIEFPTPVNCKAIYFSSQISELRDGNLTPYRFMLLAGTDKDNLRQIYHSQSENHMSYPDGKVFVKLDEIEANCFKIMLTHNALKPFVVKTLNLLS